MAALMLAKLCLADRWYGLVTGLTVFTCGIGRSSCLQNLFLPTKWSWVPVTVLLTLVLGEAAFRYVETPLRRHNWVSGVSLLRLSPAVGLVMIICVSAYASSWAAEYFISEKQLFWQGKVRQSMLDDGGVPYRVGCHRGDEEDQPECAFVHKQSKKTVVLFGDSHGSPLVSRRCKGCQD